MPTKFGIKLFDGGTIEDQISVLKSLGTDYIRPASESIQHYDGKVPWLDKVAVTSIKPIINVTWENAGGQLRQFCTDLKALETQLRKLWDKYKGKAAVWHYENEPTTDAFWGSAPMTDYIAGLEVFCKVAKEYDLETADGGTHCIYYTMFNSRHQSKNVPQVQQLINAYAKIDGLTYINFHHRVSGTDLAAMQTATDTARKIVGTSKKFMCNEFHINDSNVSTLENAMTKAKSLNWEYFIKWSGGQGDDPPVASGAKLTIYGQGYRDLIAKYS